MTKFQINFKFQIQNSKQKKSCHKNEDLECNIIAQQAAKNTLNTKTRSTLKVHKDKNDNYSNLTLCSLWFLDDFVFQDFLAKITKASLSCFPQHP